MLNYPSKIDIVTAMRNPQVSFKAEELIGGSVIYDGARIITYAGGYTMVFPFYTRDSNKVAVRCWFADIGDAKKRSQLISQHLKHLNNPYFCNFQYLDNALLINGVVHPVVIMDWVDGKPLKEYINDNEVSPSIFSLLSTNFKKMVRFLHEQNIAHGDLQSGNILVKPDGSLIIIDYDSMYIEPLSGMTDTIKGLPGYQHPSRYKNQYINSKLDYFSELVIYLSLLVFENDPSLWNIYYETEDLLFSKYDYAYPRNSVLMNRLINYSGAKISELVQKLQEQLLKKHIEELQPLEELVKDKLEIVKENITSKWDNKPNFPSKKEIKLPDSNKITNKF